MNAAWKTRIGGAVYTALLWARLVGVLALAALLIAGAAFGGVMFARLLRWVYSVCVAAGQIITDTAQGL